jgi:5-methylcytosine-specific restriction endonuclease McrA
MLRVPLRYTYRVTKTCSRCNTEQDLEAFYRQARGKDGRYAHCKACHLLLTNAARKRDQAADPEKWAETYKRRAAALPKERKSAYGRVYRERHPEAFAESTRRARRANPDLYREKRKRWAANNPIKWAEARVAMTRRRRALKRGAAISDLTAEEWRAIKAQYLGRCAYCGEIPRVMTQDHVIPLSKGGNHTRSNVVPACHPCNVRKFTGPAPPIHPTFA